MFTVNDEEAFRNRLLSILRNHSEGLTIADLAKITKSHRQTVTKYILWLEGAGEIHRRRIGAVTLHYLKEHWDGFRR